MEFDLENPLTSFDDLLGDTTRSLFLIESDHMPSHSYLTSLRARDFDISVRREAVSLISQFCSNFDPLLSYLAVNYLDRYLSSQGMPILKPWVLRLLAVSCVSLAAKMRKTGFSLAHFQGDEDFIFDPQTIRRMEALVLGALKWRMRSITPFSFLPLFISLFKLKDPPFRQVMKARATEIIFKAQNEIKFLGFKPSVIAASALLSASHELFPLQFPCFTKAISSCSYVNKDDVLNCYDEMQGVAKDGYESVLDMVSRSDTPVNVLDQQFWSDKTQSSATAATVTTVTASATAALIQERDPKRRQITGHSGNRTVLHLQC